MNGDTFLPTGKGGSYRSASKSPPVRNLVVNNHGVIGIVGRYPAFSWRTYRAAHTVKVDN